MKKNLNALLLGTMFLFCFTHCFDTDEDSKKEKDTPTKILKLKHLENGNMQYCENDEHCKEFPYEGTCAFLEIRINMKTGETCETCITEDGDEIFMGCDDNSVGCVLVTLPDPNCVVCAYVNGAIIYSTCQQGQGCSSDYDCYDENGRPGYCYDGQCHYDPACYSNYDCPSGFECVFNGEPPPEPEPPCAAEENCNNIDGSHHFKAPDNPKSAGTCVPNAIECEHDSDCPDAMVCERRCIDVCEDNSDANAPCAHDGCDHDPCPPGGCNQDPCNNECYGYCVPEHKDPCATIRCEPGYECMMVLPPCEGYDEAISPTDACGGAYPECVPNQECKNDEECPDNLICQPNCFVKCESSGHANCATTEDCIGYCVKDWHECEINLDCWAYFTCDEGEDCDHGAAICLDGACLYGEPCYGNYECEFDHGDNYCEFGTLSNQPTTVMEPGICIEKENPICKTDDDCIVHSDCAPALIDCEVPFGICIHNECVYDFLCEGSVSCDSLAPECEMGMVPSVVDNCWGPCVWPWQCIDI